jgi:miniconductance mechanosensitive channel
MIQADSAGGRAVTEWLGAHTVLGPIVGVALVVTVAAVAFLFVRRYVLRALAALARRGRAWWVELFLGQEVVGRLAWVVPLLLIHQGLPFVPHLPAELASLGQRLAFATLIVTAVRAFSALLTAAHDVYSRHEVAKDRPIKGIVQVTNVIAHLIALIFVVGALVDRSPWWLFSGLGAMTAILLVIFRDTLLSLVAGVQLTANDLIRVGDWIEMPQFNADGDVIDIALNSVRVQNWDKTITAIPAHKFLEHSFKNWRGMRESGGRRIKRSVYIDMRTVRFLTEEEIERFGRFALLRDYIARKRQELESHNRVHAAEPGVIANARRLTNVGTLRAYLINYLRQHPGVHQGMTLLVRQLQPTAEGLPIEVYAFSNDTAWASYEGLQADIFDHILAILPQFGLRVFQAPSGHDVTTVLEAFHPLQPA